MVIHLIFADLFQEQRHQDGEKIQDGNDDGTDARLVDPLIADTPFNPAARLKLSPTSCGEASILKKNAPVRSCSHTPRHTAGNELAGGFDEMPKAPE
jgi:hypothetical protein